MIYLPLSAPDQLIPNPSPPLAALAFEEATSPYTTPAHTAIKMPQLHKALQIFVRLTPDSPDILPSTSKHLYY